MDKSCNIIIFLLIESMRCDVPLCNGAGKGMVDGHVAIACASAWHVGRGPVVSETESVPKGTFVEGKSKGGDGQSFHPAGSSFLACKLHHSLKVSGQLGFQLRGGGILLTASH